MDPVDDLTPREKDVLRAYVKVGLYKNIAHRLGISAQTIKNHASHIIEKLHVANLGQAAVILDRVEHERVPTWPDVDRRSGEDRRKA